MEQVDLVLIHQLHSKRCLQKYCPLENLTIEEVLTKLDINNADMRNNAGGYYNHSLFWKIMGPKAGGVPKDTLAGAITKDFGSFENFTTQFKNTASKHFGSGWVWLVKDKSGKLVITTTINQDNPLMPKAESKGTPILALDVWEHAYYLKYQNRRADYLTAFWNVINWSAIAARFEKAL